MTDLLFLDVETGGLDAATDALLEVGLAHWRDGNIVQTQRLAIDPAELRVTPGALAVNGIDLDAHAAEAVSRQVAANKIEAWIWWTFGKGRACPAGHNVHFDLGFLRALLGAERYRLLFDHHSVDTMGILGFLADAGLVPPIAVNLDAACAHFGIHRERAHRALDDALAAAELYGHLLAMVRGRAA